MKEKIDEGGSTNKSVYEKIWNETLDTPFPKLMSQPEEPVQPDVPSTHETLLAKTAKRKFDEAVSLGDFLTEDMKSTLIRKLQGGVCEDDEQVVAAD